MCGSRKYPYLHHVENWSRGWGVKDPRNSGREGGYTVEVVGPHVL